MKKSHVNVDSNEQVWK